MDFYLPVGLGVLSISAYLFNKQLIYGVYVFTDWTINKFVDFKWKYIGKSETEQCSNESRLCPMIKVGNMLIYEYRNIQYISLDLKPQYVHDLDQAYDPDERIDSIILYRAQEDGSMVKLVSEQTSDWKLLNSTLTSLAGPMFDFHGKLPNIDQIKTIIPNLDLLENVTKIIINTENLREFVL